MQDYYTLDGVKIDKLIDYYDHKRYIPRKIVQDLKDCYNPCDYKIIKAYSVKYADNYEEFVSDPKGENLQQVKLVIEN